MDEIRGHNFFNDWSLNISFVSCQIGAVVKTLAYKSRGPDFESMPRLFGSHTVLKYFSLVGQNRCSI